jgi:hypothetical protein
MSYQITVFLNADPRDASLGVNQSLVAADNEKGYAKVYTPCRHKLVPVLTFSWESDREPKLDELFRWFNIGARDTDAAAVKLLAADYRIRRNRGLSVGDVVQVGDKFYACASVGWDEVWGTDLHLITSYLAAAEAVREAYGFRPGAPLSIIRPLGPVVRSLEV